MLRCIGVKLVVIQVDDSGSGSLVGGTCIGAIRVETLEYKYSIIPLCLYSKRHFKKKYYQNYVVEILKKLINQLEVTKDEPIHICQGYVFDYCRPWLKENNYNYISTKIKEPLQSRVENTFEEYILSLGIPREYITYTKYPLHFHRLLKWVYADYKSRNLLCKQGWESWNKYGYKKIRQYDALLKSSTFICLKCGDSITDNSEVSILEFYTNKLNKVYIHKNCQDIIDRLN